MPLVSDQRHFFMDYMKVRIIAFVLYLYDNFLIMKQFFAVLIFLSFIPSGFSQNLTWKGYFSYNEIKDLSQSETAIYAASENALFSKNFATNVLKTTNTVDGLSGETITAIHHSTANDKTVVGYANGLVIVINEIDGTLLNVVDIINKQLAPNIKAVNNFYEFENILYVSCDFGIVQYNLATLQFGDTYFIGDAGAEIEVSQTTIYNGNIYAATSNGIRRANITNPNLVDFSQWQQVATGSWMGIEAFGSELIAINQSGQINRYNGTSFGVFSQLPLPAVDIRNSGEYLVITTSQRVYVYSETLSIIAQVNSGSVPDVIPVFTAATVISGTIYIGSTENGVITTSVSNPTTFEFISPSGPLRNNIFAFSASTANLWAVYGAYTPDYNTEPRQYFGVSKYNPENGWLNIPYSDIREPGREVANLVGVSVNPANENQVFISSYSNGLLKFENDVLAEIYDASNSGLETIFPTDPKNENLRIAQGAYDRAGNLWVTNGLIKSPLKVLKTDGSWQSYNMEGILNDYFRARLGKITIDKNNTKWISTYSDGLIGFNENGNVFKKIDNNTGNLPTNYVRTTAVDNNNQLWIGTTGGLRVLPSVDRFSNTDVLTTNPIIILEDEVAQELLYEQFITDIVVDGANNKWVGTADSGIFLLSPNGQETIYRFTSTNSPLPSNNINDIDINGQTGEVFFATSKGLVSFKGIATEASDNLNNVIVYPNPVRPEFSGTVKISGLLDNCNIKIADIEGNLVYETTAEGGTIEWDTTAFGKYKVASGVYLIFIAAADGVETKVKKVMIVR